MEIRRQQHSHGAEVTTYNASSWISVSVQHTWDQVTGVTQCANSWYHTHFTLAPTNSTDRVYVYFEGVFQIADVYVNGQHLATTDYASSGIYVSTSNVSSASLVSARRSC